MNDHFPYSMTNEQRVATVGKGSAATSLVSDTLGPAKHWKIQWKILFFWLEAEPFKQKIDWLHAQKITGNPNIGGLGRCVPFSKGAFLGSWPKPCLQGMKNCPVLWGIEIYYTMVRILINQPASRYPLFI